MKFLTRKCLKYVQMQRINRVNLSHLRVRPLSDQDSLETVMEVVNLAYNIEIGNTGLAFKELDRFRSRVHHLRPEIYILLATVFLCHNDTAQGSPS